MNNMNNNNNTTAGAEVQRYPTGHLPGKLGMMPSEIIDSVGSFVTDTWKPLAEGDKTLAGQTLHVYHEILTATYPEDRLDEVADITDQLYLYSEPWGSHGMMLEATRPDSHADFGQWADIERDVAAEYFENARSMDTFRWLVREFDISTVTAFARAQDHWYMTSEYVVLPSAAHILRSRPDPVAAVVHTNTRQRADLINTLRGHQWLVLALKALFFFHLPVAEAARYDPILDHVCGLAGFFSAFFADLAELAVVATADLATWLEEKAFAPAPLSQLYAELALYLLLIIAGFKALRWLNKPRKLILAPVDQTVQNTRFIKHEMTPHGWEYEFEVDGKIYKCLDARTGLAADPQALQDEMALPGSTTYPSKKQPVGGIYVSTQESEVVQVGCFWRLGDSLVTALHVANAIDQGVATAYLGGVALDNKGKARAQVDNLLEVGNDFFDEEHNTHCSGLDVYVRRVDRKMWARLPGIVKASCRTKSQYGQVVSAVGYHGDLLVTAAGKTLQGSGPVHLWHTASTQKGFSGSPIFSGKSVVGMHVSAHDVPGSQKNVAIRVEAIEYWSDFEREETTPEAYDYTSDAPTIEEDDEGYKFKGHRARIERFEDDLIYVTDNGLAWFGYGKDEVHRNHPAYAEREAEEDEMDRQASKQKPRRHLGYEDENADIPTPPPAAKAVVPGVVEKSRRERLFCQAAAADQPEAAAYLDGKEKELAKLGFEPEKYRWPEINAATEKKSCKLHLEKFVARNQTITAPPTRVEKDKTVAMVLSLLQYNRYEPSPDYKTQRSIVKILDSNLVKPSKSPGRPFQTMKLNTNQAVLEHYTTEGFAEAVLEQWDEGEFDLRVFLKSEPTKQAKLDAGMARVITGMPLNIMVKHQAIFQDLISTGVENWGQSPIVGGFSPVVGGHIKNLAERFMGKTVYGSDKPCWDYMYHQYLFEILEEVLVELPIRTSGWTDESWDNYLGDIRAAVREVSRDANYVCSDGTTFGTTMGGAMKSGWVLTFFANSVGQLIVDSLIKTRMGVSVDEITRPEHTIMVGGDDVLQTFPVGFDTKRYIAVAKELGLELEEFEVKPSFNGVEFFSHVLEIKDGSWTYRPTRFTKHVAKLRRTKFCDLPDALVNHMRNHVWVNGNFRFFESMYMDLRKKNPDLFPKHKLRSQRVLQNAVRGLEAKC